MELGNCPVRNDKGGWDADDTLLAKLGPIFAMSSEYEHLDYWL